MKIQKGKLSTSNAVVIGVLVVVLYLVIPTVSQKKRQNSGSAPEQTIQTPEKSDAAPADATVKQESSGSSSGESPALLPDKPAEVKLRTIEEINEDLLVVLSGRNPFWTTAIAKDTLNLTEETQAKAMEVRDNLRDTLEAQEQVRSARVSLIYSSSTGRKAAIVNDEVVYPGSRISGPYLVETVHANGLGVRTEPAPSTPIP
jgi:hypothetical protein